ncbi:MAG: Holliday junction resolvase RuvX [Flavobacteriales bacterium]|jgi:putative Holliday junction resolvase
MYKALGIDYGLKRTGLAITDALQMIASPLETIETPLLFDFLQKLFSKEKINVLVVGEARHLDGNASDITIAQQKFCDELTKKFPDKKIVRIDEMFTSKLASQAMLLGGMKKKDRMVKGNLDKISAAIILQSYLENK